MASESDILKLVTRIEQEMNVINGLVMNGVEEKFKYLMIGKINGMIEALRVLE